MSTCKQEREHFTRSNAITLKTHVFPVPDFACAMMSVTIEYATHTHTHTHTKTKTKKKVGEPADANRRGWIKQAGRCEKGEGEPDEQPSRV